MNPETFLRKFTSLSWLKKDCYQLAKSPPNLEQGKEFEEKKVEDCAWTPVVDDTLLKFLKSVKHKPGWYPQAAYRAKALRTPLMNIMFERSST